LSLSSLWLSKGTTGSATRMESEPKNSGSRKTMNAFRQTRRHAYALELANPKTYLVVWTARHWRD
jgi:threonine/homoserine/homoserine lactone efflux protein